jgi:hypothetical protein
MFPARGVTSSDLAATLGRALNSRSRFSRWEGFHDHLNSRHRAPAGAHRATTSPRPLPRRPGGVQRRAPLRPRHRRRPGAAGRDRNRAIVGDRADHQAVRLQLWVLLGNPADGRPLPGTARHHPRQPGRGCSGCSCRVGSRCCAGTCPRSWTCIATSLSGCRRTRPGAWSWRPVWRGRWRSSTSVSTGHAPRSHGSARLRQGHGGSAGVH